MAGDPFSVQNPYMASFIQQQPTLYGGQPLIRSQLFDAGGMPGLDSNTGFLINMLLQPYLTQYMHGKGYVPGQFQPTQNLYDSFASVNFFQQNMSAVNQAAQMDQTNYYRSLRGLAYMTGSRFGIQQDIAAQSMSSDIARFSPMLIQMMPEMVDQLSGIRGSQGVMSHFMHLGGRYARDPITGLTGMSGESAKFLSNRVYENLYGEGQDVSKMRGLGAGEMGRMYDELNRRGFMGGSLAKTTGMSDTDIRNTEGDRISERLKKLSGVVSAMRDVFGDMGKPNAPIPEILNGLQALTQGGLANMDPGRLELMVRQTYNLSKMTGAGMDTMMRLMGVAAGRADQLGLDRQYAMAATQGAVAFGQAYSEIGRGDLTYWGKPDKDKLTLLDQGLRLQGSNSYLAQMYNAALYISDNFKGLKGEGLAYTEALKKGQTHYDFNGVRRSTALNTDQFLEVFGNSGVDKQLALQLLSSPKGTQEMGIKYGTTELVRQMQRQLDVEPLLAQTGMNVVSQFVGRKVNEPTSNRMSIAGMRSALYMDEATYADANSRNEAIATAMANASGGAYTKEELIPLAATLVAKYRDAVPRNPRTSAYGTFEAVRLLQSPEIQKREQQIVQQARVTADLQSALSGLGRLAPLRRLMTVLGSNVAGEKPIGDFISETLGGIPADVVAAIPNMEGTLSKISDLSQQYMKESDPVVRKKLLDQIKGITGDLGKALGKYYVADAAITKEMSTDLMGMFDKNDPVALRHVGSMAERLMLSKGNLTQLGKGAPALVRKVMDTSSRLESLVVESGVSLADLLSGKGGTVQQQQLAKQLYGNLKSDWSVINEKLASGRPAGEKLTDADEKAIAEYSLELKTSPEKAYDSLIGALGAKPSEDNQKKIMDYLRGSGRAGSVARASASFSKAVAMAEKKGLRGKDGKKPSEMTPAELSTLFDGVQLSAEEKSIVEGFKPLSNMGALGLDAESLQKAFPATGASEIGRNTPSKVTISGTVKLIKPSDLAFENVPGVQLPDTGGDKPATGTAIS